MFPCIEHVQIKLAPKRDERRKLEENVRLLKREHPDTELSFHAYGQANPAEPVQSVRREWLALIEDAVLQAQDMGGECVVLHGGSGIPEDQLAAAFENGINKFNVGTEFFMLNAKLNREALEKADPTKPFSDVK